jgi:thioredoxin reductase
MSEKQVFDAVVVGGGPAGAQCILWLTKLGISACMLEADKIGGLQARSPFTNSWLAVVQATSSANQVAKNMKANILEQRCKVYHAECNRIDYLDEVGVFQLSTSDKQYLARNVVLATGTSERVGVPEIPGAVLGLVGAHSMQCNNLRVAVLGGGDAACEVYHLALQKGASRVKVFARSVRARGSLWNSIPGSDKWVGQYSESSDLVRFGVDSFSPDILCICYGWDASIPELGFDIRLDETGRIVADSSMQTSFSGCYAIGDVNSNSYPCVATAMSDGVFAAKSIERSLNEHL